MTDLQTAILRYKKNHPEARRGEIARALGCCLATITNAMKVRPGDPAYKLPVQPYAPLPEIAELKQMLGLQE